MKHLISSIYKNIYLDKSLLENEANFNITIPIKLSSYNEVIERDSYTNYATVSFRIARGVRVGRRRSQRVHNDKIRYIKEVNEGKLIITKEMIRVTAGYEVIYIYNQNFNNPINLRLFMFGGLIIKNIQKNKTYSITYNPKYSKLVRSSIYYAKNNGLSVKYLAVSRKWLFLLLSLFPLFSILWIHRLLSNGLKIWLIIVSVSLSILIIFSYLFPNIPVFQLMFMIPVLDGVIGFSKRPDKSGYIQV